MQRVRKFIDEKLQGRFEGAQWVKAFEQRLYEPRAAVDTAWIRFIIFGIFLYKLLSRDFSNFGFAPPEILNIYPTKSFSFSEGPFFFGCRPIVDLVTFHWIHWFVAEPGERVLWLIQRMAIFMCAVVMLFGRGPKNIFAIIGYSLIAYLWGYLWRTSGGVDAVFLPMGMMLFYCFSKHKEAFILSPNRASPLEATRESGWFVSMCILVFVNYYFLSGVNKLTHISLYDWFSYDAMPAAALHYKASLLGYFRTMAPGVQYAEYLWLLDRFAVPITYISHLLIPIIFFRRSAIAGFWMFYTAFHYMAWMLNIFFFANFIVWFCFLPVHRFFQPVQLKKSETGKVSDYTLDDPVTGRVYQGFEAWRRSAWRSPLLVPLLPFIYLPRVGKLFEKWC